MTELQTSFYAYKLRDIRSAAAVKESAPPPKFFETGGFVVSTVAPLTMCCVRWWKQCEGEAELSVLSVSTSAESMLCCSEEKGPSSAIDMFNKLGRVTAGVIVRTAQGSARHMVANRHDIAACLDLSIPSQWH